MESINWLFPGARLVLEEAEERHSSVWPYAYEAIDLAHIAFERERDMTAEIVPGVPSIRRARNDINDDCWRFFRSIAEPLVEAGLIHDFTDADGGDIMVLPDGLRVRLKKGNRDGSTSNVVTGKVAQMSHAALQFALFPDATELDMFIAEGLWMDVVYIAGASMPEYELVGLRFAMARVSPFLSLDQPSQGVLQSISPAAYGLVVDARARILG